MRFEFATATRIIFGAGTLAGMGAVAREFGGRSMVVTGRDQRRAQRLLDVLAAGRVSAGLFSMPHEPTTEDVERGVEAARRANAELVIGFGGGSAIDAAKAISALLTNGGALLDYLEVIGRAQPLARPAAPCIAIPTTAGTGAEVTRNAVLAATGRRVKVSLRSPLMLPRVALVDPELTHDLPPALTATTGLDALTQLVEPYVCTRANPLTDTVCVDGLRRVARSLRTAVERGHDAAAREDMSVASLWGGMALANAGLGAVHGFAGPIGGSFPAPHGAVCGVLLPHATEVNLRALRARAPQHPAIGRYREIARILTGRPQAEPDDGVRWMRELVSGFNLPALSAYGVTPAAIPALVGAAAQASSMKANPLPLTTDECGEIMQRAL